MVSPSNGTRFVASSHMTTPSDQNAGLSERVARVDDGLGDLGDGQRPALGEHLPEILAVEELHRDVRRARLERAHVEDARAPTPWTEPGRHVGV
jgi:hypothetical protein